MLSKHVGCTAILKLVTFSKRTAWEPGSNRWAETAERLRAAGRPPLDLTVSNPTACGLGPSGPDVLAPLRDPAALRYVPDALGMRTAREAVAAYYRDHGCEIPLRRLCLTTSTSEAYSFLFRLLCDPGDEVLIARPSYPLFDLLATLDNIVLREYPLFYEPGLSHGADGGWSIDLGALEAAITERTRAVIVVNPNNPTGNYVAAGEREALEEVCLRHDLALIADEVFLDYPLGSSAAGRSFAAETRCPCFVLSGLSKICALPQMKASWIVTCGPEAWTAEATRRLEIIADTFLSVNAPVQHALGSWLRGRHTTQTAIRARMTANLLALERRLEGSLGERLAVQGGWTAVLRVPRHVDGMEFAFAAMERGVLVQPGAFYGLPEGRCVISLLTEPEVWKEGLKRLPLDP
ncbi:MAG TPA: pyridoxal phosphate-dependent aminotransferase [Acidobacteriaceae bacterium]|nr:pyridoxal phosphate-dependent aminotransferase [Acidobacteriaceae bacterium]